MLIQTCKFIFFCWTQKTSLKNVGNQTFVGSYWLKVNGWKTQTHFLGEKIKHCAWSSNCNYIFFIEICVLLKFECMNISAVFDTTMYILSHCIYIVARVQQETALNF